MDKVKIVEIKEDIVSRNNKGAADIRKYLAERGVFYLNVMSSPGSGKTMLLVELINRLTADFEVGVIEADIDSAADALTVSQNTRANVIQMHTGGACHITCQMSREALDALGVDGRDIIILENIGNLVCPAEFDTGANANLVLLSVPEGDDKPLKYPLMFEVASAVAITKCDVAQIFDFSFEKAKKNIAARAGDIPVFCVSAKTNMGVDEIEKWLRKEIAKAKK